MKIAFFDWFCDPAYPRSSGFSDMVWAHAENLVKRGHNSVVYAPYHRPENCPDGVDVRYVPPPPMAYRNVIGHAMHAARQARVMRSDGSIDVIHAMEYTSTAVAALVPGIAPLVLTTPGNIYERLDNVNHFDASTTWAYRFFALVTARRARYVIATSDSMSAWWERTGVPKERLVTIPLGVDESLYHPVPSARSILALSEEEFLVLFVGRLEEENGIQYLIQALPLVLQHRPATKLIIVGSGNERGRLQRYCVDHGLSNHVKWVGNVAQDQLAMYYSVADVLAVPRLSRVTPRILFQGMACKCAVVATRIPGISEFIEDGANGLLVEPRSPEPLANALIALACQPELVETLRNRAYESVTRQYLWSHVVGQVEELVYARVLSQRSR